MLSTKTKETLQQARVTYGDSNQINVAIEELCELAGILSKYNRYDDPEEGKDKLFNKVLDEVADVHNVLDHIQEIFGMTPQIISKRCDKKAERLQRWIDSRQSLQVSMVDRTLEPMLERRQTIEGEWTKKCNESCHGWEHVEECKDCTVINQQPKYPQYGAKVNPEEVPNEVK